MLPAQGTGGEIPIGTARGLLGGRLAVATTLAALTLAGGASTTPASVTLGQLPSATPGPVCFAVGVEDWLQPTVASDNTSAVPAAGTITSWSHLAAPADGQELAMKVFRKVADPALYMAVGHDGPHPLIAGIVNTFPASIAVRPGDVLGLSTVIGLTTGCYFSAPGVRCLRRSGSLADGQAAPFTLSCEPDSRLNVTATLAPSNTFRLGKVARNQKKGTATLTVNVPNRGELALSGNGLKTASAAGAVVAKTVTAPGDVKLKIRAKGKKKRKLNETGKIKVKPNITFTPTGGDPATQSRKLKLKKR